jgi:hypothetical protein
MGLLNRLWNLLRKLFGPKPRRPKSGTVYFTTKQGDKPVSEITVQEDHAPLKASVVFKDVNGLVVQPDDIPRWSSSDETTASVSSAEDGMSAEVTIVAPGATVIEVASTESNTGVEVIAQGTVTVQPILPGDTAIGEVTFTE